MKTAARQIFETGQRATKKARQKQQKEHNAINQARKQTNEARKQYNGPNKKNTARNQ